MASGPIAAASKNSNYPSIDAAKARTTLIPSAGPLPANGVSKKRSKRTHSASRISGFGFDIGNLKFSIRLPPVRIKRLNSDFQ